MKRYFGMILSVLLALAAVLFVSGITANPAYALFQEEVDEEEAEYTEEEYAAWEAADKEPDLLKSGTMLIEFMQENPESKLVPYADGSFRRLLFKCMEEKKYQELETLAEQWNAFKPGDKDTLAMIATAAKELKHDDKYLQSIEAIYNLDPQGNLPFAYEIANIYKGKKDDANYLKWMEPMLKAPEHENNFKLRYEIMDHHNKKSDSAKTIEYGQATLATIDKLKNPSAEDAKVIPEYRRSINQTIGNIYQADKKYDQAINAFLRALKAQPSAEIYFQIGECFWRQDKAENAIVAFAKAQLKGEEGDAAAKKIAVTAKESLEKLYRSQHNGNTVGIDKSYRKARETSDDDMLKPM